MCFVFVQKQQPLRLVICFAGQVPPSASAYLALSAALPALHCCALQLIQTLLWTVQGSLLMHFAPMARLMSGLLQQIAACTALDSAPAATRLRQQVGSSSSYMHMHLQEAIASR